MLVAHEAADGFLPVEAHIIEPLGSYDIVDLKLGEQMLRARTAAASSGMPATGSGRGSTPRQAHFFDPASGSRVACEAPDGS